jgi:uncharacterized membrane protein
MYGVPYHFLAVHFPLVLVLLALFYDLRGSYDFGYRITLGAAAAALIAVATGLMLAGGQLSRMTVHAGSALTGSFLILVLAMLRYSRNAREDEPLAQLPAVWVVIEVAAAVLILWAAVTGHRAVMGFA